MSDVVAGQRPLPPWAEWARQHGRLGGDLTELFDWLEATDGQPGPLALPDRGLTWAEVRQAVDAWVDGHLLWRTQVDTVNAATGAVTRSVFVHHVQRLVALAGHFGVTPSSLASVMVVELAEAGAITALGDLARVSRALLTALPATTIISVVSDRRLAALVMTDETFRPALGEVVVALAADPGQPSLREVIPVPDAEHLDTLLAHL